jgi:Zn-dependent protease with chaperone function
MSKQSLAGRAILALLLTIGFYALALAIAGGLLYGVYLEVAYSRHIVIKPTIFAVFAAAVILWSILPRIDRFVPPGPLLTEERYPDLFAVIRDLAARTEQKMPADVYLAPEVNAWVAQRGGLVGIGSRRVMGIGLPLLESVTVPQFRAIIAHEFGHYHGGDTALGPWIYKTRQTIWRTIENLIRSQATWLHKPFLWYGKFFMRVTQSISRAQERAADQLAAKIAGARNMMDALVATHRAGAAYESYWATEVVPVLANGYRPPIAAGLTEFMRSEAVDKQLDDLVKLELTEGQGDVYDSHPPLRERLAVLENLPADTPDAGAPLASTLLGDLRTAEDELLRAISLTISTLTAIDWKDTASKVFEPVWRERASKHAAALRQLTFGNMPGNLESLGRLAVTMQLAHEPREDVLQDLETVLACALATRLVDDGWVCDASLGKPVTMTMGDSLMEPFALVRARVHGEIADDAWMTVCQTMGLADRTMSS